VANTTIFGKEELHRIESAQTVIKHKKKLKEYQGLYNVFAYNKALAERI
jgi:hypothetical protein